MKLFLIQNALACSVCFGDPHSKMSFGVVCGVIFLLGVICAVLGVIAHLGRSWIAKDQKLNSPND